MLRGHSRESYEAFEDGLGISPSFYGRSVARLHAQFLWGSVA